MVAHQVCKWFIPTQLVSKAEIELLMTKCFLCVATTSSQFNWDHLRYAKHITVSYCIQHPSDLVMTFKRHIVCCSPLLHIGFFPTSTMSNYFFFAFYLCALS